MELSKLSAEIGRDALQIQGPGGNFSVKIGTQLWIKSSGSWLAHSIEENIFLPLDLNELRAGFGVHNDFVDRARIDHPIAKRLNPSIETSMHALLPQRVVLHTHSVATITHAVCADVTAEIRDRLEGLNWALVPYAKPGVPLSECIAVVLQKASPDVLVLQNHGLVVAADTVSNAAALLADVEIRLAVAPREGAPPDLTAMKGLCEGLDYVPSEVPQVHALATEPDRLSMATAGTLYPDHVVFLGAGCETAETSQDLKNSTRTMLLVPGKGVVVRKDMSVTAAGMVKCLADVLARVASGKELSYLSGEQEQELVNWDAEKLRQGLNK